MISLVRANRNERGCISTSSLSPLIHTSGSPRAHFAPPGTHLNLASLRSSHWGSRCGGNASMAVASRTSSSLRNLPREASGIDRRHARTTGGANRFRSIHGWSSGLKPRRRSQNEHVEEQRRRRKLGRRLARAPGRASAATFPNIWVSSINGRDAARFVRSRERKLLTTIARQKSMAKSHLASACSAHGSAKPLKTHTP